MQIDESVITKRKHNKGRVVPEQWILGILDTTTNIGIVRYVQRRDANTLLPIIRDVVKQRSEIWTDEWRSYNTLSNLGYVHYTVCHKREFKAADGTCTNAVEGLWAVLKKHLYRARCCRSTWASLCGGASPALERQPGRPSGRCLLTLRNDTPAKESAQ